MKTPLFLKIIYLTTVGFWTNILKLKKPYSDNSHFLKAEALLSDYQNTCYLQENITKFDYLKMFFIYNKPVLQIVGLLVLIFVLSIHNVL